MRADIPRWLRVTAPAVVVCLASAACGGSSAASRQARPADPPPAVSPTPTPTPAKLGRLSRRVRPDVLIVSPRGLAGVQLRALPKVSPGGFTTIRSGTAVIAGERIGVFGVNPDLFRHFMPQGTAEATPVWDAVARGEAVLAHDIAERHKLALGASIHVLGQHRPLSLRLGAVATSGLPEVGLIVSDRVAASLGAPATSGALLSSGQGDPTTLAAAVRRIVGETARITLLSQPTGSPLAFLTGSKAARAFGAFSYRYYPDGTIEPDAHWVRNNITWARVPILGGVQCHRLMVPQLRAALAEVEASGLARSIRREQYGGCYVPRFIESDPGRSVSLHTWGIAVDFNVATNMPGTRGDMDPRVVAIFKKWGFRWGGDWSPTDPMHFELGALLDL